MLNATELIDSIRELAKTSYYQSIYSGAKESNLKFFENDIDLSSVQYTFFKYLAFYYNINMDIALNEVTDIVLENDIYADAYIFWKNKKGMKDSKNQKPEKDVLSTSSWVFNRPSKVK
jgi:hypothetical protein